MGLTNVFNILYDLYFWGAWKRKYLFRDSWNAKLLFVNSWCEPPSSKSRTFGLIIWIFFCTLSSDVDGKVYPKFDTLSCFYCQSDLISHESENRCFLFHARLVTCKSAKKWYVMRMCISWLCPFNDFVSPVRRARLMSFYLNLPKIKKFSLFERS